MRQSWRDLLFAHWAVPAAALWPRLPPGVALDVRDGQAWLGITPFEVTGLRLRGTPPLPLVSRFPELNVRTYVTVGDRPGIWFFSLDAASRLAVEAARRLYHLPYRRARMRIARVGPAVSYASERTDPRGAAAALDARYRPVGPAFNAVAGSLEHWLTERYRLYTVDGAGRVVWADIHHGPWALQAAEAEIRTNTMSSLAGGAPPHLLFSRRQEVVIWAPRGRMGAGEGRDAADV